MKKSPRLGQWFDWNDSQTVIESPVFASEKRKKVDTKKSRWRIALRFWIFLYLQVTFMGLVEASKKCSFETDVLIIFYDEV
jgi:hypothetical protein